MEQPLKPTFRPPPADDFLGVPKQVWIIASALAVIAIISVLSYLLWDKSRELAKAQSSQTQSQADAQALRDAAAKAQADAAALREKLNQNLAQIADLQKEKENTVQSHKSLEDELRAALESKDVTISQLQGKLTVNILDRILFESGEAVLKPDGEAVLRKVAQVLNQHPTLKVHVIGHTDNVPIRPGSHNHFASNWELSVGRAISAVRFLSEKAGVDPRQLGALGYGEFRPIADNATREGRARNRRIAITVLSEELAGSDAVAPTTASVPASTNNITLTPGLAVPPPATVTNVPVEGGNSPVNIGSPED